MVDTAVPPAKGKGKKSTFVEATFKAAFEAQVKRDYALARTLHTRVLADDPKHAPSLHWLGVLDYMAGDLPKASERVEKAAKLLTTDPEIFNNLGTIRQSLGQLEESVSAYKKALQLKPAHVDAQVNLATTLCRLNRFAEARALAEAALERNPNTGAALSVLGHVCLRTKELPAALDYYQRALALSPKNADAHYNVGVALQDMHRHAEAVPHYEAAIALNPQPARYYVNGGAAYLKTGAVDKAIASYEAALQRDPQLAEAHYNLAIAYFLKGDYPAGGRHYDWRFKVEDTSLDKPRHFDGAFWDGKPAPGKTLFLHHEQGLGDTLQFIRLTLLARQRVGRVVVQVQPHLKRLLAPLPSIEVIGTGDPLPAYDFQAPIMSLIQLLGLRQDHLPTISVPYIFPEPPAVEKWKARLAGKPGVLVALSWQGNPKAKVDQGRSIALKLLEPLAKVAGVRFISIQKNAGAEQIKDLSKEFVVEELGADFDSGKDAFIDTAAVISLCDLVITTDTAIAHLAGAMGRPTWVLLKRVPDWRWLMERTDCPWYPTQKLFRQKVSGEWGSVVADLQVALEKSLQRRAARLAGEPAAALPVAKAPLSSTITLRLSRAVAAHQTGKLDEAKAIYDALLEEDPELSPALHYRGVIAFQQKEFDEAQRLIGRALAQEPKNPDIHSNYALVLKAQGQFEAAAAACRQALTLRPDYPEAASNLGNVLATLGQWSEALVYHKQAALAQPNRVEFVANLGNAQAETGDLAGAITNLSRVVALAPQSPEAHYDLATILLAKGEWEAGWREYEWRHKTQAFGSMTQLPQPKWDGQPAPNARLCLYAEQGLGDTLQFIRFVGLARARVGQVIFVVPPMLKWLAAQVVGAECAFAYGEALPAFDLQASLLSIPHLLRFKDEKALGMAKPYLAPTEADKHRFASRMADKPGFKVGLCWQGNPKAKADKGRSLPLAMLASLGAVPGVQFYSVQKGEAAGQLVTAPQDLRIESFGPEFDSGPNAFADTMAVLASLDLMITVDTSVAHLAGAVGCPTWVMLKYAADWRWLRGRTDCPWYPSMRLFRQHSPGDWASVVADVKAALATDLKVRPPVSARSELAVAKLLQDAIALHQKGDLAGAGQGYAAVLAENGSDPVALHYSGVVLHQQGRSAEAEGWIRKAIAVKPDYAEAFGNLGLALKTQGKINEAKEAYTKALALKPGFAEAHSNFGNLLAAEKDYDAALAHHSEAVRLVPEAGTYQLNLGNTLADLKRYDEAIAAFKKAVELLPKSVSALNGLGKVYKLTERYDEAVACYEKATALDPKEADAWSNMGVVLREQGDYPAALKAYKQALKRNPSHAEAWGNLALALQHMMQLDLAEEAYRKAISFKPENADSHFGLGSLLLSQGKFAEGWAEYEWRYKLAEFGPQRSFSKPAWDGKPMAGKTLFLHAEQGLGDTLQFVRYAKLAAKRVGRVVLEVQKPLLPLLSSVEGVDVLISQGDAVPAYDQQAALLSLPRLLETTLETIPADAPYLAADPQRIKDWAAKLAGKSGLRVGLAWQGNPKAAIDKGRSVPLKTLAPLAKVPDVRFISLQKNDGAEQLAKLPKGFVVETLGDEFDAGPGAFLDTAAVMMNLDLIITSDTSIAHLAGALGRPVWVMLKYAPDWRWLAERSDCPWYPSMQLFRQPKMGDWAAVAKNLASELKKIVS